MTIRTVLDDRDKTELMEYTDDARQDAQTNLDNVKQELTNKMSSDKSELQSGIDDLESTKADRTELSGHNISDSAHSDIRALISGLTDRLNALANSDDETLDQMSEIVAYIKNNKNLIDNITTNKVNVSDIINNLVSNVPNKPLSAAQGYVLKNLIDALPSLPEHNVSKDAHQDIRTVSNDAKSIADEAILKAQEALNATGTGLIEITQAEIDELWGGMSGDLVAMTKDELDALFV